MKSVLRTIILSLLLVFLTSAASAQGRVATVDLRKVFDTYWKTKQASATLKNKAADMEKEHKNMLEDWKKAKEEYQSLLSGSNDQAVSSDERAKRKKSAEDKLRDIKDTEDKILAYEKGARATLGDQERRTRENIIAEIRTVLNSKAKAAGYAIVFDTAAESAQNTPIVLFNTNDNDLTDAVLTQLNATSPSEAGVQEEKKPEKEKKK
jgi:Skp family chaperone for outer membrane proteins